MATASDECKDLVGKHGGATSLPLPSVAHLGAPTQESTSPGRGLCDTATASATSSGVGRRSMDQRLVVAPQSRPGVQAKFRRDRRGARSNRGVSRSNEEAQVKGRLVGGAKARQGWGEGQRQAQGKRQRQNGGVESVGHYSQCGASRPCGDMSGHPLDFEKRLLAKWFPVTVQGGKSFDCKLFLSDTLNSCLGERGICPENMFLFVFYLPNILRGTPLRRLHVWLSRSRQSCVAPLPEQHGSAMQTKLLPMHLPLSLVADAPPKGGRGEKRWASRRAAWRLTEWLITLLTFYELGSPRDLNSAVAVMGSWKVSEAQHCCALNIFEGMLRLCRFQ